MGDGPFKIEFRPNLGRVAKAIGSIPIHLRTEQRIATQAVADEMQRRVRKRLDTSRRISGQFMPGLEPSTKKRYKYHMKGRFRQGSRVLLDTKAMRNGIKANRVRTIGRATTEARLEVSRSQRAKVAALSNLTTTPSGPARTTRQKNREFFGYSKRDIDWAEDQFKLRMGVGLSRALFSIRAIKPGEF